MIELHVGHARVRAHPLALLLPLLGAAMGLKLEVCALILSLTCHEAGHLLAARLCNVRVEALTVMPFGCGIRLGNLYALSAPQTLAVAAGGPLSSLLLLFLDGALAQWGWLSPAFALSLLKITLRLLLFNLLPALPLDGGRMLYALSSKHLGRSRAASLGARTGHAVAAGLVVVSVALWARTRQFNLTLPACAVFIVAGVAEDRRAMSEALPLSMLNAMKSSDKPIPMRLCAVPGDYPAFKALRQAASDAATLYAVYQNDALAAFVDERELLGLALRDPNACVIDAIKDRLRYA